MGAIDVITCVGLSKSTSHIARRRLVHIAENDRMNELELEHIENCSSCFDLFSKSFSKSLAAGAHQDQRTKRIVRPIVELRTSLTELQAERLVQLLSLLPFEFSYQEEKHDALVTVVIACTTSQEKAVRDILNELGTSATGTCPD